MPAPEPFVLTIFFLMYLYVRSKNSIFFVCFLENQKNIPREQEYKIFFFIFLFLSVAPCYLPFFLFSFVFLLLFLLILCVAAAFLSARAANVESLCSCL